MAINWEKGLNELGAGFLRQADIGGLAYQDATKKEAERRAETRELAAERRALAAAEAAERRANQEWARREGISGKTAEDAAEKLQAGRETVTSMGNISSEYIARLGQAGADRRNKALTDANESAAELLATERSELVTQRRTWAEADAIKNAASEEAKERIKATVSRAEKAEAKVTKLYEGLKDANVEWDEKTQSYTSGSGYMDQIYRAQDLAAAAWKATGIAPLMSERNINSPKFKHLSDDIVGVVSYDLKKHKPKIWKDIVEGLTSDKGSDVYEKAIETITPYLNEAIKESSIRTTSTEKEEIIEGIIKGIGMVADMDQLDKDLGGAETASDVEGDPKNKVIVEAFSEDPLYQGGVWVGEAVDSIIESFKNIGDIESQVQLGAVAEQIRKWETEDFWNPNSRKWETRENLSREDVIAEIQDRVANAPKGERKAWKIFLDKFLTLPEAGEDLGDGNTGPPIRNGESGPPIKNRFNTGMLNTGGGMISSGGISPAELAYWEPEATNARAKQLGTA